MTRAWLSAPVVVPGAHTLPQQELWGRMDAALEAVGADERLRQQAAFVYARSEIDARHLELPIDELAARTDWYRALNEATHRLSARTLETLGHEAIGSCDGFIAVTSSHQGFPSLTRVLQEASGFGLNTLCFDLAGLGCSGPTHGMALAHTLVSSGTCRRVCVLCVDTMGSHGAMRRHHDAPRFAQIVAHCLSSDAAGAIIVSAEPLEGAMASYGGARLVAELWPGALDQNDYGACEHNQPYMSVGKAIRTRLVEETSRVLGALAEGSVFVHPGGKALMSALAQARPSLSDTIALSTGVLADHGNVGASSLLWVLASAHARSWALCPAFTLFALGPGIVTTALTLTEVSAP
jgi:predicted naringenin-chalcone synthase